MGSVFVLVSLSYPSGWLYTQKHMASTSGTQWVVEFIKGRYKVRDIVKWVDLRKIVEWSEYHPNRFHKTDSPTEIQTFVVETRITLKSD